MRHARRYHEMTEARLDEVIDEWFWCGYPHRDLGEGNAVECCVCKRMARFVLECTAITFCGDCIVASRERRGILC